MMSLAGKKIVLGSVAVLLRTKPLSWCVVYGNAAQTSAWR